MICSGTLYRFLTAGSHPEHRPSLYLLHTCSMLKLFHKVVCKVCEIWVCQLCPTFHPFRCPFTTAWHHGCKRGHKWHSCPCGSVPGAEKYFKQKNVIFCHQDILNYWAKEKGNSVNRCDFLKVDNLCKGCSLWLLAPSIKEPGHATVWYCPNLSLLVCLSFPILFHGTTVPIFVSVSIVWLFWDFRIFQDEGVIFLWSVGIC